MRKKSYKQVLNRLKLPPNTPQTLTCKMCGGTLHQLKINPYVCFWTHTTPPEVEKCAAKNNLFHKPVIATSQSWTGQKVTELWNEMVTCDASGSKN